MFKDIKYIRVKDKGYVGVLMILLISLGLFGFLLISNTLNFKNNFFSRFFPTPTVIAADIPPNTWNVPVKLPFPVNYPGAEDMPYISPGGNEMYFVYNPCSDMSIFENCSDTVYFPRPNDGGTRTYEIYSTTKVGGSWLEPDYLDPPINNAVLGASSGSVRLSSDGSTMYFMQIAAGSLSQDIWVSHKKVDQTWDVPYNLSQHFLPLSFNSTGEDAPTITSDGKTLYFYVMDSSKIYVSTRDDPNCDSCWSQAQILPAPVNDPDLTISDIHTYISPNGNRLYFISNRLVNPYNCPGDTERRPALFVSTKNPDSSWTQPEMLNIPYPNPCNTNDFLVAVGGPTLTSDENTLIFVGARGIYGQPPSLDLYMVTRITI